MKRLILFLVSVALVIAQPIPGRYIVELQTEPAAKVSAAQKTRFSTADQQVLARRAQIRAEHAAVEPGIQSLGGIVTHHFDTVLNGVAVSLSEEGAARLRQMPGVKGVYPVSIRRKLLDHALNVHNITQALQGLPNGAATAGAGMKIGIIDTGIDISHPGFQGFTTPIPDGYPKVSSDAEKANTNNKVIVARAYLGSSSNDFEGHGTGVAMIAAGMPNDPGAPGTVGVLSGVAPGAWLGNYNVYDDSGATDSATFILALQDAMDDGMNVVNYSAGGIIVTASDENGPESRAIANALAAGMLVVVSAGNSGPDRSTINTPAVTPAAIAVGGNANERFFWNSVTLGSLPPYLAIVPDSLYGTGGKFSGTLVDVKTIDGNGYGCTAFTADSLKGQIALIQRGGADAPCTFDVKLTNAQNAGAAGAIISDNKAEPLFDYSFSAYDTAYWSQFIDENENILQVGPLFIPSVTFTGFPALFVSQADGADIRAQLAANSGIQANLDLDGLTALPHPSNIVTDLSSGGPSPLGKVKPDMTAVGDWIVTADLIANSFGSAPYLFLNGSYASGTSFAAPLVAGAAVVLMAQRPGLKGEQYRSLLINSAPEFVYPDGTVIGPQVAGAGKLDMVGALQSKIAVGPTSLAFPVPTGTNTTGENGDAAPAGSAPSQTVTITNLGAATETYTVEVKSLDNVAVPAVDRGTFTLDPGASTQISLAFGSSTLAAGEYHGFLKLVAGSTHTATRVPYWLGVQGTEVALISNLFGNFLPMGPDARGDSDTILFRCTDAIGMPVAPPDTPTVTTTAVGARIVRVIPIGDIPGTYEADVRIGRPDDNGTNVFTIKAGNVTFDVVVIVQ